MKKIYILLAILSFILNSCNSDDPAFGAPDTSTQQTPVTISIIADDQLSVLKSTSPNNFGIASLKYAVFDTEKGNMIKSRIITNGDFSIIKDTLSQGTYRIAILATNDSDSGVNAPILYYNSDDSSLQNSFDRSFYTLKRASGSIDHFYKDFILEVGKGVTSESVVLERLTAKLEIVPQNLSSIPANIKKVTFHFKGVSSQVFSLEQKYNYFTISDENVQNPTFATTLTREQLLAVNATNPISIILLPMFSPGDVYNGGMYEYTPIVATYSDGVKEWTQVVKSTYNLQRNKILRLEGNLQFADTGLDRSLLAKNEWNSEVINKNID